MRQLPPALDRTLEATLADRLAEDIPKLVGFLQQVDAQADVLYNPEVLTLAVARYELLWLPLADQWRSALVAPLDIAFIWHCHLLSPLRSVAAGPGFAPAAGHQDCAS